MVLVFVMKTQCDFCQLGTTFLNSIELNLGLNLVKVYPRIQWKINQGQWEVCPLYKTGDFQYISLSEPRCQKWMGLRDTALRSELKLKVKSKLSRCVLYRVIRTF